MSEPRGFRNYNYGNIIDGPFARSLPGYAGSDGRFARFASPQAGVAAMDRLLRSYGARGFDTVEKIVGRWSPPNENDTGILTETMARRMGLRPGDRVDLSDPAVKARLINGIIEQENGRTLPSETVRAAIGADPMYSPPMDPRLMQRAQAQPASPFGALRPPVAPGFMGPNAPLPQSLYPSAPPTGMPPGSPVPYAPSTPFRDPSLDTMQVGDNAANPTPAAGADWGKVASALGAMAQQNAPKDMGQNIPGPQAEMHRPQVSGLPQLNSNQLLLALARGRGRGPQGAQGGPMPGLLGGM
jgi:hypothetical protein